MGWREVVKSKTAKLFLIIYLISFAIFLFFSLTEDSLKWQSVSTFCKGNDNACYFLMQNILPIFYLIGIGPFFMIILAFEDAPFLAVPVLFVINFILYTLFGYYIGRIYNKINRKWMFWAGLILVIGILSSLLLFALYWGLLRLGFNEAVVKTFIFAAFGTYTLLLIFSVRSLKHNLFTINPFSNIYLLLSVICGLVLMWVAIYIPFFQKLFETVALPYEWLWGVFGVSVLNILLVEFGKWIFRKH